MASGTFRLRPMGIGDLFDESIRLYRHNFLLFMKIGAIVFVPSVLVQILQGASAGLTGSEDSALAFVALGLAIVVLIAFAVAYVVMFGGMLYAISESLLGKQVTARAAWNWGFRRFWAMIGLGLIFTVIASLLIVTIVGWVYVAIVWGFAFHVLLLENVGIRQALGRSRALVRGSWWRVFGITMLYYLFTSIVSSIFSIFQVAALGMTLFADGNTALLMAVLVITGIISALTQMLVAPLLYGGWTLLYYDLRARKEGFDLELMARELEVATGSV